MGFNNECILNIQSLAGEYFCPVCRLLVYPNEALQSQCTHLYCKPCLTYIVSTTQACPYDGYLVTEADAKPLVESNKALAETIGKITVHCLFHRSGCTWQGPLSECTSHCSGCAFGNSPVVCNRCGIQIVHRQVQEHAQNCPGVQPQAPQNEGIPDAAATGVAATVDKTQAATQAGVTTSQVQTQTTATPPPGKDPNLQPSSNSQPQAAVQAAVPTTEQWYQQQQQYQQYYQQYPGYNQYQQYYQQQAVSLYQQQHLQVQPQGYVQPQPQSQPQLQPQAQVQPQLQPQAQVQPQLQPQAQVQPQLQPQAQVQPPAQSQPQIQPSHPPVQAPVATQPQNQVLVNQQQQNPLYHGHPQSQPHLQPHLIQPHPQHVQMPLYRQPQSQIQHTQPQIPHPVPQPQSHAQTQLQTWAQPQPQPQPHPQFHPQLHPSLPNQPQAQYTAANAVTGHHSYPQPQPHQQMSTSGPPQHSMYVHPHAGAQSQMQNQFPQQTPLMRPPQSHTAISYQQQSTLLPSPGQIANIPLAQQLPVRPHAHQPGVPVSQHPVMKPVQQPIPHQYVQQQPFSGRHQQGFVQFQLCPQGPPLSFQQHLHAYSQPQQNVAPVHGIQPHQPQNLGQPMTTNHGVQAQSYQQSATGLQGIPAQLSANQLLPNQSNFPWSNNQVQLSSEQQSGATSKPSMSDKQEIAEKSAHEREAEPSSEKTAKADNLDSMFGAQDDAVGMKIPKSETDIKLMVDEIKAEVEEETNAVDTSAKEFVTDLESHAPENVEPIIKKMVKEEIIENVEDQNDSANIDCKQEDHSVSKEVQDGPLLKAPAMQAGTQIGEQSGKLQTEKSFPQAQGAPQGPGAVPPAVHVQAGGFVRSPPSFYGSSTLQQRPAAPSMFQAPPPGAVRQTQALGHSSTHFRPPMFKPHCPQIPPGGFPVSGPAASFEKGPGHHGPHQRSFEAPSVAPQGLYNLGHPPPSHVGTTRISHGDPVGGLPLHSIPPSAYGPEGHMGQKQPSNTMEPEMFASQRPGYMDGRQPESHFTGSLGPLGQPSGIQANMMRMNGDPGAELRDERFKSFPGEHLNPFPMDPARHVIDRGELEENLKQFPRPSRVDVESVPKLGSHFPSSRSFDRVPHGFGMDMGPRPFEGGLNYNPGLKLDPMGGSAPSRVLSSYHDDATGQSDSSHAHPEFFGPGPAYAQRHISGLNPRSPFREYPGITSRGFGGLPGNLGGSRGRDDIDGKEFRRFGDPIDNSFHESRFPVLPSHMRRGEFEVPGRSGDLIGQYFLPSHVRRGDPLGRHNLRLGETGGFGGFPGRARMGDLGEPGTFPYPRLGEPGFRSSFSRQCFPHDGGIYTGDMESFDNSRKRKPPSMGWCRICKVDCETVDGLDLHSQTREHQKMAMEMVVSIKQNAKKQKLTSSDRGSTDDDANKSRNANFEGRGKKH